LVRRPSVLALGVAAAPDVISDEPLERFELLVELLGRDLVLCIAASQHPWHGLDGRAPRHLAGISVPLRDGGLADGSEIASR
jgi:hypothetical protein